MRCDKRQPSPISIVALMLCGALLASCGGPAPVTPDAPSPKTAVLVVLDVGQTPRALEQCARNTPAGERFFEPDRADVDAADAALGALYALVVDKVSAYFYEPFDEFHRQYVGVEVEGREQIYVNGFHRSAADDPSAPFDSCEEGKLFFGAQYDVETGAIVDFEFNSVDDYRFFTDVEDYVRDAVETKKTVTKYRRFAIDTSELEGIELGHGYEFAFVYEVDRGDRSKSLYFVNREQDVFGMVSLTWSVNRFDVLVGRVLYEDDFFEKHVFRGDQSALRDRIFPPAPQQIATSPPPPSGELDPCAFLAAQLAEQASAAAEPGPKPGSFEHKARKLWFGFELPDFGSDEAVDWKRFYQSKKRTERELAKRFEKSKKTLRGPQTAEEERAFRVLAREFELVARPRVYEALRAAACFLTIFQDPDEPFPFPGGPWSTPEDNAKYLPTVREEYAAIAAAFKSGDRLDEATFEDPAPRRGMVGRAHIPFGPQVEPPKDKRSGFGPTRNEIVFSWHGPVMPAFNGPVFHSPDPEQRPGPGEWVFYKLVAAYSESYDKKPI